MRLNAYRGEPQIDMTQCNMHDKVVVSHDKVNIKYDSTEVGILVRAKT